MLLTENTKITQAQLVGEVVIPKVDQIISIKTTKIN
jgi:hypothetical protein